LMILRPEVTRCFGAKSNNVYFFDANQVLLNSTIMAAERVKCLICSNMILLATSRANAGLCAQCIKISPADRAIAAAVNAEPNPLGRAIELYLSLIDALIEKSTDRNFGAISDDEFEAMRFYTMETVGGSFAYDEATELGSAAVDEIEHYLLAASPDYSLFSPIVEKLQSVSPLFNANGKTVFLGSWGMGPGEIGWLVRFLNDRPTFDRYLHETGTTEGEVDAFNDAYARLLR
ncbi:MAG TPA: hypothetical protein VN673_01495, partial [Clostridia bacterium]|nr:hypothetical protein [Clostridia bacterium]